MKSNVVLIIGVIIILLGILFMGPSMGLFSLAVIWPATVLLGGIGFLLSYVVYPKVYGLLMPAAILTVSSIPLFICTITGDWTRIVFLWPIFLVAVAIGFILMYFLGNKHKGLLLPGLIIIVVGTVAYLLFNYVRFLFPILFLAAGLTLVFIGLTARKKNDKTNVPTNIDQ